MISRQAIHEARVQFLAETGDAFGQQDVVDAVLDVRVFASQVQVAVGGGVLRHAGRPQQHLVERGVLALRQRGDLVLAHGVGGRPQIRDNLVARGVQLPHHRGSLQLHYIGGDGRSGVRRCGRWTIGLGRGGAATGG